MRVIFDTNTVISASFWRGKPFDCLSAWCRGQCQAAISPQILSEYFEISERTAIRHPDRMRVAWVEMLAESAEFFFPLDRVRGVLPDSDDEIFLECAKASDASHIVSGDKKHLLPIKQWGGIKIVSAADFLALLPRLKHPSA